MYYYTDGYTQFGPFTLAELRYKNITPQTLVWYNGLANWLPAGQLPELSEIFSPTPPIPPTPWGMPHSPTPQTPPPPPTAPAQRRKDFSLPVFIFSIIGLALSFMMLNLGIVLAVETDIDDYYYYNEFDDYVWDFRYGISDVWSSFFIIMALFLIAFSIIALVSSIKRRKQSRR